MTDVRVTLAAGNNADLYEVVFASHGLQWERSSCAFVALDQPPPYYANLTVTSRQNQDEIISHLKTLASRHDGVVCVKDSFCQLDLRAYGFETLFTASWIWREAGAHAVPPDWVVIENSGDLEQWEDAWKEFGSPADIRMFNDDLLHRSDIKFLCKRVAGEIEAGCIANISDNCIGLSNVFSRSMTPEIYADAADAASAINTALPIVGYESGDSLDYATLAGFETLGKLRILFSQKAKC